VDDRPPPVRPTPGLLRSLLRYASDPRRWWLAPLVVGLLIVGALHAVNTLAPGGVFMYPLL